MSRRTGRIALATSCTARTKHREDRPTSEDPGRHVEAWQAWAGCGDGGQVQLIIDLPAQQVRLLPTDESNLIPGSVQ